MSPPDDPHLAPEGRMGDWRRPARLGLAVVVLTFGAFGAWSAFARLDSAVIAGGRIEVESERKVVQHNEGGMVAEILVRDDSYVAAGDPLLRLDATQSRALADMSRNQVRALLAEEARLNAELQTAPAIALPDELLNRVSDPEVGRLVLDQKRQFDERRASRINEAKVLAQRIEQAERQIQGLRSRIDAARAQVASYDDEMAKLKPLLDKGLVSVTRMRQLERARLDLTGQIGSLEADVERQADLKDEARLQIEGIAQRFLEQVTERLAAVRKEMADQRERVRVAEDVLARSTIRAPRAGRIVGNKVHTIGYVVRPGETLMEIVPSDDVLVVTAKVSPVDVTYIRPQQSAEIRIPGLAGRTSPLALGEVASIGADVVVDELTRQPYYAMKVSVKVDSFPEAIRAKLVPGMPAEVLVATGERTMLDYLTQPLMDSIRVGMREH